MLPIVQAEHLPYEILKNEPSSLAAMIAGIKRIRAYLLIVCRRVPKIETISAVVRTRRKRV